MPEKNYYVHSSAIVESKIIGKDTRIWAFCHVLKDVKIGEDCNLCDNVFVENGVTIGNRVTIKNGIAIWTGVTIEDDVFLGPNCVVTNDLYPRSKGYVGITKTLIKKGASIGANATIICGNNIGKYAMIGAGAVVTKEVPDFAVIVGNPGRFKYWISRTAKRLIFDEKGFASDEKGHKYQLIKGQNGYNENKVIDI